MKYLTKEFYILEYLAYLNKNVKVHRRAEKFDEEFYQFIYNKQCGEFVKKEEFNYFYNNPVDKLRKIDEIINSSDISEIRRQYFSEFKNIFKTIYRKKLIYCEKNKFDKQLCERWFAENQSRLIEIYLHLPTEILNEIADIRLFALGYASERVTRSWQIYCTKLRRKLNRIKSRAYNETNVNYKYLSGSIMLNECFEGWRVTQLKGDGDNIIIDGELNRRLIIKNAKVIEGEDGYIYPYNEENPTIAASYICYVELHRITDKFELCFLMSNSNENEREELWYLSIECDDVIEIKY